MAKLLGKVAIVTGASRGIGQQIAELFASEGAKVVCAARTANEGDHRMLQGSLSRTVDLIRGKGGEATAVTADVSVGSRMRRPGRSRPRSLRTGRHPGKQRRAELLPAHRNLSHQSLDPLLRHQRARAFHPGEGRAQGHDPPPVRRHRQYQFRRRDRTRTRPVRRQNRSRGRDVRRRPRQPWNASPRDWRRKSPSMTASPSPRFRRLRSCRHQGPSTTSW